MRHFVKYGAAAVALNFGLAAAAVDDAEYSRFDPFRGKGVILVYLLEDSEPVLIEICATSEYTLQVLVGRNSKKPMHVHKSGCAIVGGRYVAVIPIRPKANNLNLFPKFRYLRR